MSVSTATLRPRAGRAVVLVALLGALLGALLTAVSSSTPARAAGWYTSAPACAKAYPTLAHGSRGCAVEYVQKRFKMKVTGYYSSAMVAVVKAYERRHGLAPDGRFTRGNWRHIRVPYAKPKPKPQVSGSLGAISYRGPYDGSCKASYYWQPQPTASGERFYPDGISAAHKTWRFGTRVIVTNTSNGRSVVVRINDRGPYIDGRCLDLSRGAMRVVRGESAGVINVRYKVL